MTIIRGRLSFRMPNVSTLPTGFSGIFGRQRMASPIPRWIALLFGWCVADGELGGGKMVKCSKLTSNVFGCDPVEIEGVITVLDSGRLSEGD